MERALTSAIFSIALGVAIILVGPSLTAPIALYLTPQFGSTEAIEIPPGGAATSGRQLNSGDRLISDFIVQGGGNVSLRIEDPDRTIVGSGAILGRTYTLDYKATKSGIFNIYLESNSKETTYMVTRTIMIRTILGFDVTLLIGAVVVVTSVRSLPALIGTTGVQRKRGLIQAEKITRLIPDGQAVIVSAPACDEYESLIGSFLRDSLRQGKTTLYISMNGSRVEEILRTNPGRFLPLICDSKTGERLRGIGDCEVSPGVADLTGLNITTSKLLEKFPPENPGVVILDIVADVLLIHSLAVARKWLTQTISKFKGKGLTVLAGVNPTIVQAQSLQGAIDTFDGHLELVETTDRGQVKKYLHWVKHATPPKH